MAEMKPLYRFRGSVAPSAQVKRPVNAYRNADGDTANGSKPNSATIDIFDVIDSWGGWWGISAAEVDAALAKVGNVDTLYVRVNSPGGEATEGIAIANLLRAHAAEIRVTVYGLAASAASYISTAGDTVAMAPGSMMMVHCAWNVIRGNAEDLRTEAGVLDKLDESIASLYALKAGGNTEDWHALMRAETWYTADDAVDAKLADRVGIESAPLPANVAPAEPLEPADGDETPFDRAARMFDLSVFSNAPAAARACSCATTHIAIGNGSNTTGNGAVAIGNGSGTTACPLHTPTPPAEPPEHPHPKGADAMSDTEIKALRERLGLGEDADEATVLAKVDELLEQATAPTGDDEVTEECAVAALAKATGVGPDKIKAAVDGAAKGKVTISETMLEELQANAALGAEARGKQLETERDDTIEAAFRAGKISAERRDHWKAAWDKDPEGAKADLDSLPARFPIGQPQGYAGSDGTDGDGSKPFTDDEADALAQLAGVSKEALTR